MGQHDRRRRRVQADGRRRRCAGSSARRRPTANSGSASARPRRSSASSSRSGTRLTFFVDYANIAGFRPRWRISPPGRGDRAEAARPLARRAHARVRRRGDGRARKRWLAVDVMRDFEAYPRRPLELVHPPLAPALLGRGRGGACARSGTRSCRRSASSRRCCRSSPTISGGCSSPIARRGPESVYLAGWPEAPAARPRAARRDRRGAPRRRAGPLRPARRPIKLRQPLRRIVVQGRRAPRATPTRSPTSYAPRRSCFAQVEAVELNVKPRVALRSGRSWARSCRS